MSCFALGWYRIQSRKFSHRTRFLYWSLRLSSTLTYEQEIFLSNNYNKQQLIDLLAQHLQNNRFNTEQSEGDDDTDIASAAIRLCEQGQSVVVSAEDTDILALLLFHWQPSMAPVFFKSDGKANRPGNAEAFTQYTYPTGFGLVIPKNSARF